MVRARKHGGSREGTPGASYSNRTDLNSSMPKATAPAEGRGFGAVAADEAALAAVPMGAAPKMTEFPSGPSARAAGPPPPVPGTLGYRDMTSRPDEPITAGSRFGPGPGPEILATSRRNRGMNAIESAAARTNDPYLNHLLRKAGR